MDLILLNIPDTISNEDNDTLDLPLVGQPDHPGPLEYFGLIQYDGPVYSLRKGRSWEEASKLLGKLEAKYGVTYSEVII